MPVLMAFQTGSRIKTGSNKEALSISLPISRTELETMLATSPLHGLLGLTIESFDSEIGKITLISQANNDFMRTKDSNQWHGGALSAVADVAVCFAMVALTGRGVPTIQLSMEYLRPAINTNIIATAEVQRAGRQFGFVDATLQNDQGKLIALGRAVVGTST